MAAERSAENRGVSTVFGSVFFLLLIVMLASALFIALNNYNDSVKQAIANEDARSQEKIVMTDLVFSGGTDYIVGVTVTNLGSITSQIRAFYVDNEYICDPSDPSLNSDGAIVSPQANKTLNLPITKFNPTSCISLATSRAVKTIELESNFLNRTSSGYAPVITNYGPLRLNFSLFYYRETTQGGSPIGNWQNGSSVSPTVDYCEWNITVTNIDTRDITLNQYSSLTLVTNEGGGQFPWYIDNPSQLIASNQTLNIIYIWETPLPCSKAGGFSGFSGQTSKVFLTFYGKFSDGDTYAQTIPFEAILRK